MALETMSEVSNDPLREELLRELDHRLGRPRPMLRVYLKILIWEWTLRASYVTKRLIDILSSLFFLTMLLPFWIVVTVAILLEDGLPILFVHPRVGKDGRIFPMYKFRSMIVGAEKQRADLLAKNESKDGVIFKMKEDPRITRVGRVIRRWSVDETPQFLNVLRGEMSLVGPRPLPVVEVAQFTLQERKRLHVKPGITCIWQVSGRSDIGFHQQMALDLEYIRSRSFFFDLWLLLRTIAAVLSGRGAY